KGTVQSKKRRNVPWNFHPTLGISCLKVSKTRKLFQKKVNNRPPLATHGPGKEGKIPEPCSVFNFFRSLCKSSCPLQYFRPERVPFSTRSLGISISLPHRVEFGRAYQNFPRCPHSGIQGYPRPICIVILGSWWSLGIGRKKR